MKYLEDKLQKATATILDYKNFVWFHPANERKTTIQQGVRLKDKGVKSGVPDCMIFEPNGNYNGLAIELKAERDNGYTVKGKKRKPTRPTLSDNQKIWFTKLKNKGWKCEVAYNTDEVIKILDNYMSDGALPIKTL